MRRGNLNFAIAIAVSLAAHLLLWPASKRMPISIGGGWPGGSRHSSQITLVLKPSVPDIDTQDQMGEHDGKGTGDQPAKGDTPLKAREADQDQPFLSRDPVGHGHVGDPPAFNTGIRGQNGQGGQAGGSSAPQMTAAQRTGVIPTEPKVTPSVDDNHAVPAAQNAPQPQPRDKVDAGKATPAKTAPDIKVASAPSETPQVGASKPDVVKPVETEVKATDPLVAPKIVDDSIPEPPLEGPQVPPVTSNDAVPPPAKAPKERVQIALATPPPAAPPAPRDVEPKPVQQPAQPQTPAPSVSPPAPAVAPASVAPALVHTGDSRAPGVDKAMADPAQESESESDPFSKNAISAVLHDGKLDVRDGRKVKTTRPHFLPGAIGAFLANPDPVLVLKVSIDPAGNVKDVDVIRSTGSVEIDQPCRVAVYDWWFEPAHDKKGKPVADVVLFTIRIR